MCFMKTNKLFEQYTEVYLNVFPALLVFCKMNVLLLSSLPNMIIDSVSRWIGGRF